MFINKVVLLQFRNEKNNNVYLFDDTKEKYFF